MLPQLPISGLGMLLMLFIQYGIVASSLPKVGYIKGTDLWLVGCTILIMIPTIESTAVGYMSRKAGGVDKNMKFGKKEMSVRKFVDVLDAIFRYSLIVITGFSVVGYFVMNTILLW